MKTFALALSVVGTGLLASALGVAADQFAYVASQASTMSVLNLTTKSVSATISFSLGEMPRALVFTPNGAFAYITVRQHHDRA